MSVEPSYSVWTDNHQTLEIAMSLLRTQLFSEEPIVLYYKKELYNNVSLLLPQGKCDKMSESEYNDAYYSFLGAHILFKFVG